VHLKLLIQIAKVYKQNNFRLSKHLTCSREYMSIGLHPSKWFILSIDELTQATHI